MQPFPRKISRPSSKLALAVVAVVLVIIFFTPLSRMVRAGATPFLRAREPLETGLMATVKSRRALERENQKLEHDLAEARLKLLSYEALEREHLALKELFGREGKQEEIAAGILTFPNQSLYNTFQIDAGSSRGVAIGARVFAGTGVLLGEVTEVLPDTATVTAFASPGKEISVFIPEVSLTTTLVGRGGEDFQLELPRELPFTSGMIALSQGMEGAVVAVIERVISDPRDPFQTLLARVPVNMRTLRFVKVAVE